MTTKTTLQSHKVTDQKTDIEMIASHDDVIVILWNGEGKTIEAYTSGTSSPLYIGSSMEAARESLGLSNDEWDSLLAVDVEYLEPIS